MTSSLSLSHQLSIPAQTEIYSVDLHKSGMRAVKQEQSRYKITFCKANLTHEFGYSILVKSSNSLHEYDHFREFVTKLNIVKTITFEHHFHRIQTKITVYDVLEPNMV